MKPSEKSFEEAIEKLVIINLLSYDEFRNFLYSGINPLQELFLGLFKDFSLEKILETYKKYYQIYSEPLMEIFTGDLKRIETHETEGRKFLKIYEEEIQEIQKEDRNEILVDKYTLQQYIHFGTQLLLMQISNNIRKRELKGENLISTKMALKKLLVNGVENKQTLDTYNELIVEANAQLKIFKLPKSFRKFEKKVKEALLSNHREMLGENFEETCFEAMKKVQQDAYELNMEQRVIKTGAEPELTLAQIKSIRKTKDFFQQSKLIESILENRKFQNVKKLKEHSYEYMDGKARKVNEVSLNEIENEIYRLRHTLGLESQQEYFNDEERKEPNMQMLQRKVEEIRSSKFKSITNFREFNKDEDDDEKKEKEEEEQCKNGGKNNENNNDEDLENISSSKNTHENSDSNSNTNFSNNAHNTFQSSKNDTKNSSFFSNKQNSKNKTQSDNNIQTNQDQKALKRLEIIRDMKLGFKEEFEGSLQSSEPSEQNPAMYFDLDIFKGKSLEELKILEVEELHEAETKVSSDGSMHVNQVQIGDSFYKYAQSSALKNSSTIDLSEQQAESNFQSAYSAIREELVKKDKQRAERIVAALESGQYLDDPFYIGLLMKSKKYLHVREKFLKKYYRESSGASQDKNNSSKDQAAANMKGKYFADLILRSSNQKQNLDKSHSKPNEDLFEVKTPLLNKYLNMPGDIVDNMINDGIFEKFETDVGKVYVNILKNLVDDIDAEEGIGEKELNLEEYEDSALKDYEKNDSSFNVYELQNKIGQENDDLYVSKEEIEKELGWKKVARSNSNVIDGENGFGYANGNYDSAGTALGVANNNNFVGINNKEDYVPGSKRGNGKKKIKKFLNK